MVFPQKSSNTSLNILKITSIPSSLKKSMNIQKSLTTDHKMSATSYWTMIHFLVVITQNYTCEQRETFPGF